MELLCIIFFLWLISCAFPSSGSGHHFEPMMVVVFIVCAAALVGYVAIGIYIMAGVDWLTDSGWVAVLAGAAYFVGTIWLNKWNAERLDRRDEATRHN
jgi:uncharacterized membrane protein